MTPIPPEIKKWIEDNAYDGSKKFKGASDSYQTLYRVAFESGATSLYQHLQENGRVAELEKELANLSNHNRDIIKDLKAQREQLIEKDIEINRLITIIEKGN